MSWKIGFECVECGKVWTESEFYLREICDKCGNFLAKYRRSNGQITREFHGIKRVTFEKSFFGKIKVRDIPKTGD